MASVILSEKNQGLFDIADGYKFCYHKTLNYDIQRWNRCKKMSTSVVS